MPRGSHTRFYGSIPYGARGERLLVHLYEIGGVERPATKDGLELHFRWDRCVLRIYRRLAKRSRKPILLHEAPLPRDFGPKNALTDFITCSIKLTWLEPVTHQTPVLCLVTSEPGGFGRNSELGLLVFTRGFSSPPMTQLFTSYGSTGSSGDFECYNLTGVDARGYLRAETIAGDRNGRQIREWFWTGDGFESKLVDSR